MEPLFLGIDLGTSAVKALVIDPEGKQVGFAKSDLKVHQPGPNCREQDLEEAWQAMLSAVRKAISRLDPEKIRSLSFSATMHGFMPIDRIGKPLSRMMIWADARAQRQAEELKRKFGVKEIYRRTGCPVAALYYPARILWLKKNQPRIFQQAARFASIKDAIIYRLTGRWVMDKSQASSNGILRIHQLKWDEKLLGAIGIGPERLPDLIDPEAAAGELWTNPAKLLGLKPGMPVIAGAGDGGLANLGSGAINPGQAAVTIGSSGAVRKIFKNPWINPDSATWCYYLASNLFYAGGAINSGGIILNWLRDGLLAGGPESRAAPYEKIIARAKSVSPGAEGLIFLPYLFGERTPYWNPDARGVFFGIAPEHRQEHFARAVLEGITMAVAHIFSLLENSPGGVSEIRASGGFIQSEFWGQLLADLLGKPVIIPGPKQGSALGAAILAMVGAGAIKNLGEARKFTRPEKIIKPDLKKTAFYRERFSLFLKLYQDLLPDFRILARMQNP